MTANVNPLLQETASPDELRPGTKLLHGQYEIKDYLNSGGFGITYLAKDSLDRQVVIKECFASAFCRRSETVVAVRSRAHTAEFTSLVRLFVQEAKNLAKLKHPNIVGVHQIFEDNDTAYMALDYINGRDLLDLIEDPNDRISPADVQSMTLKLLNAIGYIHSTGVLHRDISPDNILLERGTNNPVLIDFGAAREDANRTGQTLSVMRVVKDGYSPQEFYIQGSEQTPSSDLYAFGATLYHLITGECPPDSQSRLAAIAAQKPDPLKGFDGTYEGYSREYLDAIIKAMQIFPYERLQSAKEWIDLIRPGPELITLPGGKRVTPRRVVSQRLEDAQAQPDAEGTEQDPTAIPEGVTRPDSEIEVVRAKRPARPERPERARPDLLNVRITEPPKPATSSMLPMMLGAAATCIVIGLGVVYFVPGIVSGPAAPETGTDAAATLSGSQDAAAAPVIELPAAPQAVAQAPTGAQSDTPAAPSAGSASAPQVALAIPPAAPEAPVETHAATAPAVPSDISSGTAPETAAVPPATPGPAASGTTAAAPAAPDTARATDTASDVVEPTVSAPQAALSAPQAPLTTAPAMAADSSAGSEDAPDVLATIDPTGATAGAGSLAPAPSDAVANGLPSLDVASANRPVEAASDVQEVSAVMSRWNVDLPFAASSNVPNIIGVVRPDAPDWVQRGTRILRVNGQKVGSIAGILEIVRQTTWIKGRNSVPVSVAYTDPNSSEIKTAQMDLSAVRDVALMNGMQFETARASDGSWVTTVVASSDSANPNGLKTGDRLVAFIPTSEKIDGPDTISRIFEAGVAAGTSRYAFAVNRGGDLWVSSLEYTANKN